MERSARSAEQPSRLSPDTVWFATGLCHREHPAAFTALPQGRWLPRTAPIPRSFFFQTSTRLSLSDGRGENSRPLSAPSLLSFLRLAGFSTSVVSLAGKNKSSSLTAKIWHAVN